MSTAGRERSEPDPFPDGQLGDAAELGHVDDRSVRVWVRAVGTPELRARLDVDGEPAVVAATPLSAETDWTGAVDLRLSAPAPDRPFVCDVGGRRLSGRLAPAPGAHAGFAFGFGSCHRPFTVDGDQIRPNAAVGIYPAMLDELHAADARFLLLIGDQVYADELAPISISRRLPDNDETVPSLDAAVAAYRWVTRGYFGQVGFRRLREAFPTYCMWDDHDIRNNWGSQIEETPRDARLFAAAGRVYGEYQHVRNPGGALGPPPFPWAFRIGTAGVLALDTRGARDARAGILLGAAQWDFVRAYLRGPEAHDLHTLFVVASVPVVHVARWFVALMERLPLGFEEAGRDRWSSAPFVGSRDALLAELFAWQTAVPYRQVVVLSGDVHAAGAFTIFRREDAGVVQQFTSSAFTVQTTLHEKLFSLTGTHAFDLAEPTLRIERHLVDLSNNYGLVRLEPLPGGGHRVAFEVRAWDRRTRSLRSAGRLVTEPAVT